MKNDQQVAIPIPFLYWFGLQNLRCYKCCRAIKTEVIEVTLIVYQCPLVSQNRESLNKIIFWKFDGRYNNAKNTHGPKECLSSLFGQLSPGWITLVRVNLDVFTWKTETNRHYFKSKQVTAQSLPYPQNNCYRFLLGFITKCNIKHNVWLIYCCTLQKGWLHNQIRLPLV